MVLLIDANIVLDYLLKREPFYNDAKKIMDICCDPEIKGCIALHTITTLWYILRKFPDDQRRIALFSICSILEVTGTSHDEVINALEMREFKDFEDCIQTKCAKTAKADYIITRNTDDFIFSEIPAITPIKFIEKIINK
ncbi:MAG: PIN domain-containing protein [Oscillospiraceae bacterium]|nr:PIN domain-containing protein [Oscillospiraceae bacterium]